MPDELATNEQILELKRLIELMNIPPETYQKWLDKAEAESWDEVSKNLMQKFLDAIKKKLTNGE